MSPGPQTPAASQAGLSGWTEAILYNVTIAIMSIAYAVAVKLGAHIIPFIFISMTIGALGLIAVKGPGEDWLAIMLHPLSWAVGGTIIGMEAFYCLVIAYVPPADGSLVIRLSIPLSLIIGYLAFRRRSGPIAWVGGTLVFLAVLAIMWRLALWQVQVGLAAALTCAVIINARSYATEFHPWNRRATTVPEKMRVTGIVVLGTAVTGLLLSLALVLLVKAGILPQTPLLPQLHQYWHMPTLLLALLVGSIIYSALHYLGFSSVAKIGAENFIASAAFTPLMTLAVQEAAQLTGLIGFPAFDWRLLPSITAAIVGVLLIVWSGRQARIAAARPR